MIPAHGYKAFYAYDHNGREHVFHRPVIAWHADTGQPLVVDPEEGKGMLVPAHTIAGFKYVQTAPTAAYIPGGGWMAEYLAADGQQRTAPVIAWRVDDFGQASPVVYHEPDEGEPDGMKIWHPGHSQTQRAE